jgi:hypothetical protein
MLGLVVGISILIVGCSASKSPDEQLLTGSQRSAVSDSLRPSNRLSHDQGTMQFLREFHLHSDGRVTDTVTVEGTHTFASYWREKYDLLAASGDTYSLLKEDGGDRFAVKAKRVFADVDELNQTPDVSVKNVDGILYRLLSVTTDTGPYDPQTMVNTYGASDQATSEDWIGFLQDAVTVDIVVTDEVTGKTLRWHRTAGQIGSGLQVELATEQWYAAAYLGGIGVSLLLGFVVYMGTFGRRHWEVQEE